MSAVHRQLLVTIRVLALVIIGLHLLAPMLPEEVAWGVWPATYLPAPWRWGLALLACALVLWGDRLPALPEQWRAPQLPAFRWAVAAAAAVPFCAFRLVHTRWGDAYILVHSIAHPDVRLTYTWQAPLDVFLHAKLWAAGNRIFGWTDAMPAYWVLSPLAGILFVWALLGLVAWLGRTPMERLLLAGLVLTLGTMQLFFGYVENYSFMTVGVLLYIWLGLRALHGQVRLLWPASVLALTHAFHPSTLILAPSLLYLSRQVGHHSADQAGRRSTGRTAWLELVLPYVLVGLSVLALMTLGGHGLGAFFTSDAPGGGDRRWFVPLFETGTRWEHYTMFSWQHLSDIVNQQLLVAPMVWPSLILVAVFSRGLNSAAAQREGPDHNRIFLSLVAASYLFLTLVWNPDYGGQRDWDLFAPAAVPAALLLAYRLPRALAPSGLLAGASWALLATQAYHTLAWIYQNTRPWSWS